MRNCAQKKPVSFAGNLVIWRKLPNEEEQKAGKRDEQLTLTVGVNEVQWKDGDSPAEP